MEPFEDIKNAMMYMLEKGTLDEKLIQKLKSYSPRTAKERLEKACFIRRLLKRKPFIIPRPPQRATYSSSGKRQKVLDTPGILFSPLGQQVADLLIDTNPPRWGYILAVGKSIKEGDLAIFRFSGSNQLYGWAFVIKIVKDLQESKKIFGLNSKYIYLVTFSPLKVPISSFTKKPATFDELREALEYSKSFAGQTALRNAIPEKVSRVYNLLGIPQIKK